MGSIVESRQYLGFGGHVAAVPLYDIDRHLLKYIDTFRKSAGYLQPLNSFPGIGNLSWKRDKEMTTKMTTSPTMEGKIAVFRGEMPDANPYSPSHPAHRAWIDGYESEIEFLCDVFDACYGPPQGNA